MPKILMAHKGSVLTTVAFVTAFIVLLVLGYSGMNHRTASSRAFRTLPTSAEVIAALGRVGLVPEALAAGGVSGQQATTIVTNARAYLADHLEQLRSADAACATASRDVWRLRDLVQSGRASAQDRTAFTAAKAALASANAQRQSVLGGFLAAATANVGDGPAATIATIAANRTRDLPTQYLVISRTEAQWVALREALDNTRIAGLRGEEPSPAAASLVASANSDSASIVTALQANLATVTAAWNSATQ